MVSRTPIEGKQSIRSLGGQRRGCRGAERGFSLWLLIESAAGVERLGALLEGPVPVAGVMLGAGDLRADLGLLDDSDRRHEELPNPTVQPPR